MLRRKCGTLQRVITRLRRSTLRSSKKRLKAKLAEQAELDRQYRDLCEKLLK